MQLYPQILIPILCIAVACGILRGMVQAFSALDRGLIAYNTPGSGMQTYLGSPDRPARAATVRLTRTPPETQTFEGNTWIRVKYTSVAGEARIGWVTNGTGGYESQSR
uniref:Uncharacterized protein n=1 Tax=Desertifilum tharense IPPAS B-1220 TaxID=1781255 RepID=A0ACD5GWK9_9CYAN